MFLMRSAFWLTLAFMVVGPTVGADMGETGRQIAGQGQQALAEGLKGIECDSLECTVGRAVAVGALGQTASQSDISPMQDAPYAGPAPVPPPRPDWAS